MAHDHSGVVENWMTRTTAGKSPAQMARAFEEAFAAMWRRSGVTLGEITLVAIADRVLHDAAARFPILAPLQVSPAGLDVSTLRERLDGGEAVEAEHLREAIRFALVRFLTVLGNLTADILTRPLHSELSKLASRAADRGAR